MYSDVLKMFFQILLVGLTFFFKTEVRRVHRVAVVGGDRDAAAHRRGGGTLDGDPRVQADPGGEGGDSPVIPGGVREKVEGYHGLPSGKLT